MRRAWLIVLVLGCARGAADLGAGVIAHDKFFVIAGSHRSFTCDQCHTSAATGFALAQNGVGCIGCHGDVSPQHASVGGFALDDAHCISCHKDGSGGLPANHNTDYFPVTGTKHASFGCADCHGATKALADLQCTPCHTQSDTAGKHSAIPATTRTSRSGTVTNYQWSSAFCVRCHADGQVDAISSHPGVRNGITGGDHQPFCIVCHGTVGPGGGKAWSADFATYSCLACHNSNNGP